MGISSLTASLGSFLQTRNTKLTTALLACHSSVGSARAQHLSRKLASRGSLMSMIDNAVPTVQGKVVKNRHRFKRFLANNKAVLPADCAGPGDIRTTCELIADSVSRLTAKRAAA